MKKMIAAYVPRRVEPLWLCPKCDRNFTSVNQQHSCVRRSLEDFLQGKDDHARRLFKSFVAAIERAGPIIINVAKTRVSFQVRMNFAAVNRLSASGLAAHVILARRMPHPRIDRILSLSPRNHVHSFSIREASEIDDDVRAWLREAYEVGQQRHLER